MSQELNLDPDSPDVPPDANRDSSRVEAQYLLVENDFARIDGILRRLPGKRSRVVVIQTHPRRTSAMNLSAWPMTSLVSQGVDTFAFNNRATNSAAGTEVITIWEDLALDVAAAVVEMRRRGYEYVVLYGHSAGGPLVSYYQNIAENGNRVLSGNALSQFGGYRRDGLDVRLPPADSIVTQSSTAGTAYSFLMRLDGSVIDEERGTRDPDLDPFTAANGFDHETGVANYSSRFLESYYAAQCSRMNRLIEFARRGRRACKEGLGVFVDDDLIVVCGIRGELSCVDLSLASATTRPFPVATGTADAIVTSNRRVVPNYSLRNSRFRDGGTVHTLRSFLSYRAIGGDPKHWSPEAIASSESGVDLTSSNTSTSSNISGVTVPVLLTSATADTQVHLPSAELIFSSAARASRKRVVFIVGAEHDMTPIHEQFGDTRAQHLAVIIDWLGSTAPIAG